jgi:hypothetical protein
MACGMALAQIIVREEQKVGEHHCAALDHF